MFVGAQGKINKTSRNWEYSQYILLAVHISALSIRVVPSESNLLQRPLVGPSVSDLCRTMGLRIVDTVHRRSKYTSYSKYYWAYWEYFGTASTRSTNPINTNGRNTCSTHISTEPRDTWSTRRICCSANPKYCIKKRSTYSIFSDILCFSPKYWEQLWKVEVCTHATH